MYYISCQFLLIQLFFFLQKMLKIIFTVFEYVQITTLHFYAPKDKLPRIIIVTAKQHNKAFGMCMAVVFIQNVYISFP